MSSTNVTEFYGLTQYAGSDKPSFTDNNEAFRAIDAALHGAVAGVEDASDAVTALTGRVGDVEEAVTGLSGTVGTQGDAITALQNKEISQDGDIAEVKAAALDMICAFNEEAAQSVHAYAIGDFFRYNDVLYKASAVINIGDTIIPNTNCVATNVTEQLLTDVDKVGDLSSLTTTDKTSAVAAINEAVSDVGDLSSLTTTDKTSAVAAINEVKSALPKSVTSRAYIDISPSTANTREDFVPTSDGYVILISGGNTTNDNAGLFVNDGTNDYYLGFATANSVVPCFVRKGSILKVSIGSTTNSHVRFLPLS